MLCKGLCAVQRIVLDDGSHLLSFAVGIVLHVDGVGNAGAERGQVLCGAVLCGG